MKFPSDFIYANNRELISYLLQGGLIIMDIVGTLGGDFIIYLMVVVQTVGRCWIYGLNRLIRDIEFMLGMKLSAYWKLTWAYIIPAVLIFIFCYSMATYEPLGDKDTKYVYPSAATGLLILSKTFGNPECKERVLLSFFYLIKRLFQDLDGF